MSHKNIKILLGALACFVVLLSVASVTAAASSSSDKGFFQDFWERYIAPLKLNTVKLQEESSTTVTTLPIQSATYKPVIEYEKSVVAAVKRASPAVVSITISKNVPIIENCPQANPFSDLPPEFQQFFGGDTRLFYAPCQKGTKLQEVGGGSGFIITPDGLILTNKHVVSDTAASYTVFTNDGKKYPATVLARDPAQDLAVIKIVATNLPLVELADSDKVELGQSAIAIGNALGEYRNTVSVGVVSGLARTVTASGGGETETIEGVIQTDAAINPGNSGGPLLNLAGQVIGINTAVAQGAQSVGFAIPINRAKRDIESVKATGKIESAFIGIRYVILTPEIAKTKNLKVEDGAYVSGDAKNPAIVPNSPAERAGILEGDVITEINGKKVDREHRLGQIVAQYKVGEVLSLKILRNGAEIMVKVVLDRRPE